LFRSIPPPPPGAPPGGIGTTNAPAPAAQHQAAGGAPTQQQQQQQQGFNFFASAPATNVPPGAGGFVFPATAQATPQAPGFIDPQAMAMAMAYLQAMQMHKIANKPTQEFPKWDGSESTRGVYIERLKTFQLDPFFAGARWDIKDPAFETQSSYLRGAIFAALS
jgi:hypothetical protein